MLEYSLFCIQRQRWLLIIIFMLMTSILIKNIINHMHILKNVSSALGKDTYAGIQT